VKKVLITGVAGFIGQRLALQLLENQDVEVFGIDSLTDYYAVDLKESRLRDLKGRPNFSFQQIDICDTNSLVSLLASQEFDSVIHLAAQAGIRLPLSEYSRYVDSNLTGFSNILLSSAQHKVSNFLYASSSSVYGNSTNFPLSELELNPQPVSFYGSTKLSNEILARGLTSNSPMRTRGLRFFTVYGPMGRPDMAYFRIAAALHFGKTFSLFGDGAVKRDFTFVGDVVNSIISLGSNLSDQNLGFHDVVNVGGGKPCSMLDLVSTLENISGKKLSIKYSEDIAQDVRTTVADTRRQKDLIGVIPETLLEDGLLEVWEWIKRPDVTSKLEAWTSGGIH
jgi:UDP-glucuronate 4-epimerase